MEEENQQQDQDPEFGSKEYVDALQKSLILEQNVKLANQTIARLDQLQSELQAQNLKSKRES